MNSFIKKTINSVFVHVDNLRLSAEWYSKLLGLKVLEDRFNGGPVYWIELEGYTGIILDDNSVNIERGGSSKETGPLFMYGAQNVLQAYKALKKQGIKIMLEIETPHEGLTFFNFEDPDGNVFMVCSADENNAPVEKIEASPIHNRIPAVFVNVTDLQKAADWHFNLLGMEKEKIDPKETIVDIRSDQGADILLDNIRYVNGDNYKIPFMFGTDNIDEAYSFIQAKDFKVFTDIERNTVVSFFTILDPDDHVIMICQSHEMSEWSIGKVVRN